VLVVRRARNPALSLYTLPGGVVETGETLLQAVAREVREETALTIEPVALAGHREAIVRDAQDRVERHFVILCFAARWLAGEPVLNEELDDARWLDPAELSSLRTTEGLAEIVAAAIERLARPACLAIAGARAHIMPDRRVPLHEATADHRIDPALPCAARARADAAGAVRRRPAAARRNHGLSALPARDLRRQGRAEVA
jgi:ADP-ribose pyrophosphatase YjhB (NUDIX family)